MSNILTAIKASEKERQNHTNASVSPIIHPMKTIKDQRKTKGSWLVPVLIAVVPAACIVGYKMYVQQSHVVTTPALVSPTSSNISHEVSPSSEVALVAKHKSEPVRVNKDIEFLSYPVFTTEPLPQGHSDYYAPPAEISAPAKPDMYAGNYDEGGTTDYDSHLSEPVKTAPQDPYQLDTLDFSGVDPKLAQQLKSAIAATDGQTFSDKELDRTDSEQGSETNSKVIPIADLPASVQNKLPSMNFQQHIYSSTPQNRWVKVNGQERHEGDTIASGVVLKKIEQRDVILGFDGYDISMPSLSEW